MLLSKIRITRIFLRISFHYVLDCKQSGVGFGPTSIVIGLNFQTNSISVPQGKTTVLHWDRLRCFLGWRSIDYLFIKQCFLTDPSEIHFANVRYFQTYFFITCMTTLIIRTEFCVSGISIVMQFLVYFLCRLFGPAFIY